MHWENFFFFQNLLKIDLVLDPGADQVLDPPPKTGWRPSKLAPFCLRPLELAEKVLKRT